MRRLVGLLLLAACVEPPPVIEPPVVRCNTSDECAPGQECIDNNCFGDAAGEFAAELFAPQTRTDMLARAEVQMLDISEQNQVEVMFGRSIELSGRVLLRSTDETSVAARVVFSRPSRIPGAPDYVVQVDATSGKRRGEAAFRARLLPNEVDEHYTITIFPDDTATVSGGLPPSRLAPPAQIDLPRLTSSLMAYDVTLDHGGLREVQGLVLDAQGAPMRDMVVRAWSRRSASDPLELVSSTGRTDANGRYTLFLPLSRSSRFELRVSPAAGVKAPRLVRRNILLPLSEDDIPVLDAIRYPALPPLARYQLPVLGPDAAGGRKPALGATVIFDTTLASSATETVTYETQTEVGIGGVAEVDLIPALSGETRTYRVTVLPLAIATDLLGSRWDEIVPVGSPMPGTGAGGMLPELMLPARVHVSGRILDSEGKPARSITVRPQLTDAFLTAASAARDRLSALRLPEVTTTEDGVFSLNLDATLVGLLAEYDLELVPPSGSPLPRWSRDRLTLPTTGETSFALEDLVLPASSLVSGFVRDETGAPVADAEVRVYSRTSATTARQRAIARSDSSGKISLVLPVSP